MTDKEKETAFRGLLDRQRDIIWSVCKAYSFSAAWEPEDAMQEVLCVLWRDYDTFKGRSSERTWVYRVATTTMLMLKRKSSNRPQPSAEDRQASDNVSSDEGYSYLMQMIESMDERDAQIVTAHLHGFKQTEIATMTGITNE